MVLIVRSLKLDVHQIDRAHRRNQEENFHCRVIYGDEACEEVQVAAYKNDGK